MHVLTLHENRSPASLPPPGETIRTDPFPMTPIPTLVRRSRRETHDTFSLDLELSDDHAFAFEPGQFNMLYLYGIGEVPISISSDPDIPGMVTHTTRAVGVVTKEMQKLTAGSYIGLRGPYGGCWPMEEAKGRDVVLVAGGIGLAPLRPVICSILARREYYNKVTILFGARTPEDLLFRSDLRSWKSRMDMDVQVTVDRATSAWRGHVGVVPNLVRHAAFHPQNTVAMICGPEVMIRYTVMALQKRGVDAGRIFVSMERNMKCAIGLCGHCQWGPSFVCREGPVYRYADVKRVMSIDEL
jgi:NAD(P)H-flavin reductase